MQSLTTDKLTNQNTIYSVIHQFNFPSGLNSVFCSLQLTGQDAVLISSLQYHSSVILAKQCGGEETLIAITFHYWSLAICPVYS